MELIKIGKIAKTHGFKGHIKVYIDEFYMNDFEDMQAIFINQLPYFISKKDINSNSQAILLLEDIDTKEKAQKLQGKEIFAKDDDLTEILDGNEYDELINFIFMDKSSGKNGKIIEIIEMPFQFLAKVQFEDRETLIPLNDDFILSINRKKHIVEMCLPEGLLDIN
ncbi:MAG TPA: ribosome maturation factor RimM [Chitinophagales bacterium]|nr:ribosome maturation factor RimM [Chitinophagales bacterium]HMW12952.1 ribosome maturation factor RimM [Chitinophagales bacterium]HMX59503.1 ribosome maturation factor RimM [Chitinophagales bacterium]HMY22841.1 ribosome maturation factor RimM [Chitinophagales bacterium]HMZ32765.1 ribosome maturation factor RimM [Chitinophagales bacterium]